MSACKVTKILAFTSMKIPTNTKIHKRLTIAINGYTWRYRKGTWLQKRLHLALQKRCILLQPFAFFMQPFTFSTNGELLKIAYIKQILDKFGFSFNRLTILNFGSFPRLGLFSKY